MGCGWPGGEQIHSQEFTKVKIRKKFIVTRRNKIKENIVFIEANMTRNSHIFSQLDFFSAKRNPGYALLVNAPWGSGKSFLLRKWMGPRKDCLYVSLYGLVDSKGIEDEIFNSLLTMKGSLKPPKGVSTFQELSKKWAGISINLTGAYRRQALKALPRILVFDDLERAEMTTNQLLGFLNQYVEHSQRNVILVANEEQLRNISKEGRENYASIREKVIGRVITVVPETDMALAAFIEEIFCDLHVGARIISVFSKRATTSKKLAAKLFLEKEKEVITSIFNQSESKNLRLLRQALIEFVRFHSSISDEILKNELGMRYLLGTFIALTIAYHAGNGFNADDLDQKIGWERAGWKVSGRTGEEPTKSGIELLQERYQGVVFVQLNGNIMTGALAKEFIGKGHANGAFIVAELQKSEIFQTKNFEAWRTLWFWWQQPEPEVSKALMLVKEQMQSKEVRIPEIILHLGGIALDLSDEAIGWATRGDALTEFLDYIAILEHEDKLPRDRPKYIYKPHCPEEGAFGLQMRQQGSSEFKKIFTELTEALERAFWKTVPEQARILLELASKDVSAFSASIDNTMRPDGVSDHSHFPVMTGAKPSEAAQILFGLAPEDTHKALSPFKDRIIRLERMEVENPNWPSERDWLKEFRKEAELLTVSASNPIRASQIRQMLRRHLTFLDQN